jgi:hypothetical protein
MLELPDFIFILSNRSNRQVAVDITKRLENLGQCAAWDFREPVHDAINSFVDVDFGVDLGVPGHMFDDDIDGLEHWVETYYGPDKLGAMAWEEAQSVLTEYTVVFRDATWTHIKPFVTNLKPHKFLIVDLFSVGYVETLPISGEEYAKIASRILIFGNPTVENVIAAIEGACK